MSFLGHMSLMFNKPVKIVDLFFFGGWGLTGGDLNNALSAGGMRGKAWIVFLVMVFGLLKTI